MMQQPYGQPQYGPPLPPPTNSPVEAFVTGYIRVWGESEMGQRRYAALRAAKVVAQRDLIEVLQGVSVTGDTTVQNGLLANDIIRSTVQGFLQGARECGRYYDPTQGVGYVCLEMPTRALVGQMWSDPNIRNTIQQLVPQGPMYTPQAVPPVTQAYDALIIDARQQNFRPALVNRVLTDSGEIIYDPTKIAEEILAERGCGDYTNDPGKAQAILQERGAKNPLLVKAVGVAKFTDVKVSSDDASKIFAANQKTHFLEAAKVVFVLR
jgi:hypothetical protein